MPEKTVQVSVRVSERDAAFLSQLQIDGATTPSEKLRALLRQARQQREGLQDYATELDFLNGLHRSAEARRLEAEKLLGIRSDLLRILMAWLIECDAFLLSASPSEAHGGGEEDGKTLRAEMDALEAGAADRVFALIDQVMRLGVTANCAGYDPAVVRNRMQTLIELIRVILSIQNEIGKEKSND